MMLMLGRQELSETLLSVLLHSGTSRRSLKSGAPREEKGSTLSITYVLQVLEEDNPVYAVAVVNGLDLVKDIIQVRERERERMSKYECVCVSTESLSTNCLLLSFYL